jgi:hypothetical protein
VEVRSIQAIVRALNEAEVRYLIAGGLAVLAHGYMRATADLDLILDLSEENLRKALTALTALDYRPKPPVAIELFADAATRAQWVREKGLTVFSLFSPAHQTVDIDLFVEAPLDFARAYAEAERQEIVPGLPAVFVSLPDLLAMKRQAGRTKDLIDIENLEKLEESNE